jgi:hypothetical protein
VWFKLRLPSEPIKTSSSFLVFGKHTKDNHAEGSTPHGCGDCREMYTPCRLTIGSHANLKNFSPWKYVPSDKKNQSAMNQLVSKKRKELMVALIPGINIDGTEGAMTQLAQSISRLRHIKKHDYPGDHYHPYELIMSIRRSAWGINSRAELRSFVCVSTSYMMFNIARLANYGWHRIMAETNPRRWSIQLVRESLRDGWHRLQQHGGPLRCNRIGAGCGGRRPICPNETGLGQTHLFEL